MIFIFDPERTGGTGCGLRQWVAIPIFLVSESGTVDSRGVAILAEHTQATIRRIQISYLI